MASKIWRNLIRTAAAACFVAGSSAQAGGVFYASDFDPLLFRAKVIFEVDGQTNSGNPLTDKCLHAPTLVNGRGLVLANSLNTKCSVSLYSAVAELTDDKDTKDTSDDETAYISFVSPTDQPVPSTQTLPSAPTDDIILGLYVIDNQPAGIWWAGGTVIPQWFAFPAIGPVTTSNFDYPKFNDTWWLRFANDWSDPTKPFDSIALLYHPGCLFFRCNVPVLAIDFDGGKAEMMFSSSSPTTGFELIDGPFTIESDGSYRLAGDGSSVPEPGSLALLGGALVAGWLTRRRKAAA